MVDLLRFCWLQFFQKPIHLSFMCGYLMQIACVMILRLYTGVWQLCGLGWFLLDWAGSKMWLGWKLSISSGNTVCSSPLIVSEVRNMLCLYNTPVVHNSEIRFDFVTLSCFGYNHLKYIHGPTPFKMAALHGKEMAAEPVYEEPGHSLYAPLYRSWL